jgi:hypothetical protein
LASQPANANTMVAEGITSPLVLLAESEPARDVLLLSFNVNLGFFERFALAAARARQALVTVVGDAGFVHADPMLVRYAGTTYLDGRALCRQGGLFHPKLVVITTEASATVAVGSGNVTLGGWHANAELWTILRGDAEGAPATFGQLATWLRGLHEQVRFSAGVEPALERVAAALDRLPQTEPGPQLVSSLAGPILGQLPTGPVDALTVAAPFLDEQSRAVDALAERLQPGMLEVLVQPGVGVYAGEALTAVLAHHRGFALSVDASRYHHGKLYEWTTPRRRVALTGSPNASTAALLLAMAEGGNCELGLLSELDTSRRPPVGRSLGAELASHPYRPPPAPAPPGAPLLLGAVLVAGGLRVLLGRPLAAPGRLEVERAEVWSTVAEVPDGVDEAFLVCAVEGGAPLRIVDGDGQVSLTCHLTDPSRVLRRRVAYQGRVRVTEETLFDEPRLAEAFLADLANLRAYLQAGVKVSSVTAGGAAPARQTGDGAPQSWEEYLDACQAFIGEDLVDYALGLPRLTRPDTADPEEFTGELEDDKPEQAAGDPDLVKIRLPDGRRCPEPHRQRFRRFFEQLADASADYATVGRLLAVRLILRGASCGYWNEPAAWVPVVARATTALEESGRVREEERAAVASLAAVGLAALHSQVPRFSVHDPLHILYDSTRQAVASLLDAVDPDLIASYASELVPGLGPAVEPAAIDTLIEMLRHPTPIDEAIRVLEDEWGIVAERHGQLIDLLQGVRGDPLTAALRAVGLAQAAAPVAARASTASARVAVVWQPPQLVVIRRFRKTVDAARYNLTGLMGPHDYAVTREPLPAALVVERWRSASLPPTAQAMLMAVGLDGDGRLEADRQ